MVGPIFDFEPAPCNEYSSQSVHDDYHEMARMEAITLIQQLYRQFQIPSSVSINTKWNNYEPNGYLSIIAKAFDDDGLAFLFELEDQFPTNWDEQSKSNLEAMGYKKNEG